MDILLTMKRYLAMKSFLAVLTIVISGIYFISCDSQINQCFGVNLEGTQCDSENILGIGQQDGLGCFRCTGQDTEDQFSIAWQSAPLAGTSSLGVMFLFLNTTDKWLAEFSDCQTISLFETFQNEFGGFVKGELAGTLGDIDPFQIDKLSLTIDIPGVRTEEVICNFCSSSTPPQCLETVPYL